jgi:transmembrane sensor
MATDPNSSARDTEIEHEASVWLARRDRGLAAAEQDELFQWLADDPRHGEWLARHQQTVKGLKLLAQWKPEHGARPNPDLLAVPSAPTRSSAQLVIRWLMPVGLAAAAGIAAFFGLRRQAAVAPPAPFAESPPIVRKVLDDGSTIDLNRGAEVEVSYNAELRNVRLVRGEASFTVAKNPDRPFIVSASAVKIRAVGTAFNVNFHSKAVEVLVTEGRVQISASSQGTVNANQSASTTVALPILKAGQRTVVSLLDPKAPKIEVVSPSEIARIIAWQPRLLEFNDTPLAQVVAEFNASNRVKMVVNDPVLASLSVDASLRSDNVEGFVRLLETSFHVKAERRPDGVIVLHRIQ